METVNCFDETLGVAGLLGGETSAVMKPTRWVSVRTAPEISWTRSSALSKQVGHMPNGSGAMAFLRTVIPWRGRLQIHWFLVPFCTNAQQVTYNLP